MHGGKVSDAYSFSPAALELIRTRARLTRSQRRDARRAERHLRRVVRFAPTSTLQTADWAALERMRSNLAYCGTKPPVPPMWDIF